MLLVGSRLALRKGTLSPAVTGENHAGLGAVRLGRRTPHRFPARNRVLVARLPCRSSIGRHRRREPAYLQADAPEDGSEQHDVFSVIRRSSFDVLHPVTRVGTRHFCATEPLPISNCVRHPELS